MFFELHPSLLDHLGDDPDWDVVDAISNLAQARLEGKHLVWAESAILRALSQSPLLEHRARLVFRELERKAPTQKDIRERLLWRVEVLPGRKFNTSRMEGPVEVLSLSVDHFAASSLQSTALLTESPVDAFCYIAWAKQYAKTLVDRVRIAAEPSGGSGSTAAKLLSWYGTDPGRLCVCIADSDRTHPEMQEGSTAAKLREASRSVGSPRISLYILPVREAENLIPAALYAAVFFTDEAQKRSQPAAYKKRRAAITDLQWLEERGIHYAGYWDAKQGLTLFTAKFDQYSDQQNREFWKPLLTELLQANDRGWEECSRLNKCAKGRTGCKCILLPGLGRDVLEAVADSLLSIQPATLLSILQADPRWPTWQEIGDRLVAWSCAGRPMRNLMNQERSRAQHRPIIENPPL